MATIKNEPQLRSERWVVWGPRKHPQARKKTPKRSTGVFIPHRNSNLLPVCFFPSVTDSETPASEVTSLDHPPSQLIRGTMQDKKRDDTIEASIIPRPQQWCALAQRRGYMNDLSMEDICMKRSGVTVSGTSGTTQRIRRTNKPRQGRVQR